MSCVAVGVLCYEVNLTFQFLGSTPPKNGRQCVTLSMIEHGKLDGMMGPPMWRARFEHGHQRCCCWPSQAGFHEPMVLWAPRVGAARASFATPCKPVGHVETIGTLVVVGWCTVVLALNANSLGPNEIPCNGWSLHLLPCSYQRRPWPRMCQVGNGSR